MTLDDVREFLYGCTHCGTCKDTLITFIPSCPAGEKFQLESYYPSGMVFIARAVSEGILSLEDEEIRDRIYACTGCLSCEQQCGVYHRQYIFDIVKALRTEAVTHGYLNPPYMIMFDNLRREDNVFGKPKSERADWADGYNVKIATKEKVDVLYHVGCTLSYEPSLWDVPRSVIEIMSIAGVDVGIMGKEECCCGGRSYETGYLGEFTKYAEHSIDTFNSMGANLVITSCSDGYATFKKLYPLAEKPMKFKVLHTVEFIHQLIRDGALKFTKDLPIKVTYHDPCHLGRHMSENGVYDTPREVLNSIPGVELVEMERTRENSWCCGAGAGVSQHNPDYAMWTANERLKEARRTGAEALITSCPWCEINFKDAAKEYKVNMEVYDIAQIIMMAIK